MFTKANKITVVGTGTIGSTVAYTLMIRELASEIVLVNRNKTRAQAKAWDMAHCTPLISGVKVSQSDFQGSSGSDIVVITSGTLPKEDGKRMDVLANNIEIYKNIIPEITRYSPEAVIVLVTNPLDVMAYIAYKLSGFPPARIIGSGTFLDTIRFKYILGEKFNINASSIEAVVIGEHGDSMVPVWSQTKYCDAGIHEYADVIGLSLDSEMKQKITEETKRAGWDIRLGNEHSCYGISFSVVKIIEGLLGCSQNIIPVSTFLNGEYGINNAFLSMPVTLCKEGVKRIENLELSGEEIMLLKESAAILHGYIEEADRILYK